MKWEPPASKRRNLQRQKLGQNCGRKRKHKFPVSGMGTSLRYYQHLKNKFYEKYFENSFENIDKMDIFFEKYKY